MGGQFAVVHCSLGSFTKCVRYGLTGLGRLMTEDIESFRHFSFFPASRQEDKSYGALLKNSRVYGRELNITLRYLVNFTF